MCPFCIANLAMIAAGLTSTGGLTAFVAKKLSGNFHGKIDRSERAARHRSRSYRLTSVLRHRAGLRLPL
jgi:hypothetical protein